MKHPHRCFTTRRARKSDSPIMSEYIVIVCCCCRAGEKPAGSLDLRLAVDISPYDKGKGDVARFNIDFGEGEKVYKFKAASASEGERWVKSLNDWRDYFLLRSV